MNEAAPAPAGLSGRFFSLKWKTLALVSLVLAVVHVGLVVQGYHDALGQFEARQALAFQERGMVLQKLLAQSEQRLQRIASLVPGVINTLIFRADFDERWTGVQLELQLDLMQLYGADGAPRVRGMAPWAEPPAALRARIVRALGEERPTGFILCEPRCTQYALVPVLGAAGERQMMVLGTSLADVVLEFPGLTGAAVAVMSSAEGLAGESYWGGYRLEAVSDAPSNEPKLRALALAAPLPVVEQGAGLGFGGRQYRFQAWPLSAYGGATPGYFVILADTTEALADIRGQIQRQLLAGLTALLAALALLLAVMNRPMNHLRKLAQALPLLARHQYQPAREMIGSQFQHKRSHSEIDVLEAVAADLSRQLEELEQTVAARNDALAEKVAELHRANELNEKIFATAPMVIVIQGQDGRLLQMNEFGRQLLGYSESEVRGMPFLSLLADPRQKDEASTVLVDVIGGRRALFEQTGPVLCVDGGRERITWLHSRLAAQSGVYVLSIGLPDKSLDDSYRPH
ncbi:MAG: PAS domain S-box protein [Gammaproteobacteria bacterium]|nr:PAS domain S-box protein [Gammaproteobacteria bacterium]